MVDFLPNHNVVFLGHGPAVDPAAFDVIGEFPDPEIFTWSYKFPPKLQDFCSRAGISLTYVEDGFLRSIGLGAERSTPLSLVFDRKAMHFDRLRVSELEELLMTVNLEGDTELLATADRLKHLIVSGGLTKYVLPRAVARIADLGLPRHRERVLVLGQVEDDLSIRYGASRAWTCNELVRLAKGENPAADILYRPHPESLAFPKPHYSDPAEVATICKVLGPIYSIGDCISAADTVYTVTSLAGFEAVLHGKRVVTIGRPFYSGWGFTEDRDPTERRSRRRPPIEVLAIAYGRYPHYFDQIAGRRSSFQSSLGRFLAQASNVHELGIDRTQ